MTSTDQAVLPTTLPLVVVDGQGDVWVRALSGADRYMMQGGDSPQTLAEIHEKYCGISTWLTSADAFPPAEAISELVAVAKAGTPSGVGGTPDLFAPDCATHGRQCEDPWWCHEKRVDLAVAAVSGQRRSPWAAQS